MSQDILSEKLDKVLKCVTEAQSAITKADGRIDAMKSEEIKKLSDESANAMQEIQDIKAKQASAEKIALQLETKLSRAGGPGEKKASQYVHDMTRYLRRGHAISQDVVKEISDEYINKCFYGLTDSEKEYEVKTLIAGVNPNGGYFIIPDRVSQMIKRIFETSPIRQFANIITTTSDTVEMIIDDNEATSGGWVAEIESRPETATPQIGLKSIPIHEQYASPVATQKLLDDAGFDVESWLTAKVVDIITRTENTAFVVGDGSKKPEGLLSLDPWAVNGTYERGKIEQINSGTLAGFTADGMFDMQGALKEFYQPKAIWLLKRASWTDIVKLKDDQNRYLLSLTALADGVEMRLLGKPVIFADDVPGKANDSLSAIYGDISQGYTVVDRIGFRVIRDDITQKGKVLFYTTKRTGGAVTNYESYKILKLSA